MRPPRLTRGRRALVAAVALPVAPVRRGHRRRPVGVPAKGQSLLPTLPDIVEVPVVDRRAAHEVYLSPGSPGPNELHLILPSVPSPPPSDRFRDGGAPQRLRQFTLSPAHYVDFVVLAPGTWHFSVTTSLRPQARLVQRDTQGLRVAT